MYDSLVRAGALNTKEGAQQPLKQYLDVQYIKGFRVSIEWSVMLVRDGTEEVKSNALERYSREQKSK